MVVTGVSLGWSAITGLLANEPVAVNVYAYLVAMLSIGLNVVLVMFKLMMGRMTGNLALLSDAKDNEINIKISVGVMVGLSFDIFRFYFVDSLVALVIAGFILWDGMVTLKELVVSGEDLSVDTIRLSSSARYDDKITDWILSRLVSKPATPTQLNSEFLRGLATGYRYFDIHAIIGHHQLQRRG